MLQLLHLVKLIINSSNKTNSIVIHSQKVLNQLVEELQELNFMIYFNLVLRVLMIFNLRMSKWNREIVLHIILLIFQYNLRVKLNKFSLLKSKNLFYLSNKIHINNLLNLYLKKLLNQYLNKQFSQYLNKFLNQYINRSFSQYLNRSFSQYFNKLHPPSRN